MSKLPPAARIAVIVALLILIWLWPKIESRFKPADRGTSPVTDRPMVIQPSTPDASIAATPESSRPAEATQQTKPTPTDSTGRVEETTPPESANRTEAGKPPQGTKPAETSESAGVERPAQPSARPATAGAKQQKTKPDAPRLQEIRRNVFRSAAGLIYLPGSSDGHRLNHVLRHARDDPEKPVHGVFDGDRETVLAVIDEAFESAQRSGSHVRRRQENDRLIITVNMKRRVGYSGGESGARHGRPECRFIRLVLENDNEVVTAYPVTGF